MFKLKLICNKCSEVLLIYHIGKYRPKLKYCPLCGGEELTIE